MNRARLVLARLRCWVRGYHRVELDSYPHCIECGRDGTG